MEAAKYSFDGFVVDAETHTLWREGRQIPIQEQPFQILLGLVMCAGEMVTREALQRRLWGTHTFVDFDQSLNSALRRLRRALGDDSRAPVYIETLPRLGFRFLMPVSRGELLPVVPPPSAAVPWTGEAANLQLTAALP